MSKLEKVKAIITRHVKEEVICTLKSDGTVDEIKKVLSVLDSKNIELHGIRAVISNN